MFSRIAVLAGCAVVVAALAASAHAAPNRSSLSLVVLPGSTVAGATIAPSFGSQITYGVATYAAQPWVETDCYQNGRLVYTETRGFFASYYTAPVFTLGPTLSWTSGGAACTASLFSTDSNGKRRDLASTSFSVTG